MAHRVSIIIPCYNCVRYLSETLESLERQNCKDFQVICVNDGSTDETPALLQQWQDKKTLDMTVIHQKNGGVSVARNAGIEAAQTEFVLFLDGDDVYHPDYVATMLAAVDKSGADTVYCPLVRNPEDLNKVTVDVGNFVRHEQAQVMENLMLHMECYGFYCYLYRREVLQASGIRFTVGMRNFEDREFNWKYLCHCHSAAWIDQPMYGYRVTPGSAMSGAMTWDRARSGMAGAQRIVEYMKSQNCDYLPVFENYLPQRLLWGMLCNCAVRKNRELYHKLAKEYNAKSAMKHLRRSKSMPVKLSAAAYLVHPGLMYHGLALARKISG
jgi:glycosyltransferase involved in cell wall biosynthesis